MRGRGECEACKRENFIGCKDRVEIGVIGRNGAYAEYVVVPARFAHRVPDDLDMKKAALCEPLAVAIKGLKRLERAWAPQPKVKTCAVVGSGPLGHLCAKVLAHRGHDVTAFDRDERRRSTFAGSAISVSEDMETLDEFDVLVEASGDQGALETMLKKSRAGATLLLLGLPYAHREFTFESVVAYDKTIVGSVGSGAAEFGSPDIKVGRSPGRSDQELCDLGRNRLIHGFFWDLPEQYFLASVDGRLRRPRSGWGACSAAAKSRRKAFNLWLLLDDRWAGDTAQVEPVR